jgi:dihydrofolate reductase
MRIRTHMGVSVDGYVAASDGRPAVLCAPGFAPRTSGGYPEFIRDCGAVVMGRTTFEPALDADRWPWPDLQVFVLTTRPLPDGTPSHVVAGSDPTELVRVMQDADFPGDVHLVGGPATIRSFAEIGALDRLEIVVLPVLLGAGLPLSPAGAPQTSLKLESGGRSRRARSSSCTRSSRDRRASRVPGRAAPRHHVL